MPTQTLAPPVHGIISYDESVQLADGLTTTVHVVRYYKSAVRPRLVIFDTETRLTKWCRKHNVREAINGGYFWRPNGNMLGETWLDGVQIASQNFAGGQAGRRGSLYLPRHGEIQINKRNNLPRHPDGDLLEIGPLLVMDGVSTYARHNDPEGFSKTAFQHDEYIDNRRHPRAALASNGEFIWTVAVDGRSFSDAGMYLSEFADFLVRLGATEALNLDGGRSASQISRGKLQNIPRSDQGSSTTGFPIRNAIIIA